MVNHTKFKQETTEENNNNSFKDWNWSRNNTKGGRCKRTRRRKKTKSRKRVHKKRRSRKFLGGRTGNCALAPINQCGVPGGTVAKCCNRNNPAEGGQLCHFKDEYRMPDKYGGIKFDDPGVQVSPAEKARAQAYYQEMQRKHTEYGNLDDGNILNGVGHYKNASTLNVGGQHQLQNAANTRWTWMDRWMKPGCWRCDANCRNHEGRQAAAQRAAQSGGRRRRKTKRRQCKLRHKRR